MKKYLLLIAIIFSSCTTSYDVRFIKNEITSMSLSIGYNEYYLRERLVVAFPVRHYRNQLTNTEYIGGWIKIGNELFTFNKDEIYIRIITAPSNSEKLVNIIIEENGINNYSEEEINNFLYDCIEITINKIISKRDFNRIYRQDNNIIEAYFEYNITVNDEIIEIKINEIFTYRVEKSKYLLGEILLEREVILE